MQYDYDFWPEVESNVQQRIRWKWRWTEAVSSSMGGNGYVGLEIWFFDQNGRIRFHGQGAGIVPTSGDPPDPIGPFYVSYFGYDEFWAAGYSGGKTLILTTRRVIPGTCI